MKRLTLCILLSALIVGVAGELSAYLSDVETSRGPAIHAGTLDISPGRAWWLGNNTAMRPCGFAVFMVPMQNVGTLPLDYEATVSVSGDLARVSRVYTLRSSGHLDVGAHGLVKVYVLLPCRAKAWLPGESGHLEVTAWGKNGGFWDVETWRGDFSANAED
jgi:hypothetical protein